MSGLAGSEVLSRRNAAKSRRSSMPYTIVIVGGFLAAALMILLVL